MSELISPDNITSKIRDLNLDPAFDDAADLIVWYKHQISLAKLHIGCLIDEIEERIHIPEKNCSCHVTPPCNDCVEFSLTRENLEDAKNWIKNADSKMNSYIKEKRKNRIVLGYYGDY